MKYKENNEESIYDTIFNFIFSLQKKKKKTPPIKTEGYSDYASGLVEVGMQPLVFPIEKTFEKINKNVGKATEIDIGGGVSFGFGSGALLNPSRYAKGEILKNRSKARWASIGGSLHSGIDSALVSLYARSNGLSSKTSVELGAILRDLIKEQLHSGYKYPTHRVLGSKNLSNEEVDEKSPKMSILEAQQEAKENQKRYFSRAVNLRTDFISKRNSDISKKNLITLIRKLQKEVLKEERIKETIKELTVQGVDVGRAENVAEMIWGEKDDSNMGLYLLDKETLKERFQAMREEYGIDDSDVVEISKYYDIKDLEERKDKLYSVFIKKENINTEQANIISEKIASMKLNEAPAIAKDSVYWVLAADRAEKLREEGKKVKISTIKKEIEKVLEPSSKNTLGMKVERALLVGRWIASIDSWSDILIDGDWEKFGFEELPFTRIVEEKKAIKDGEVVGSYYVGADSVIGKILGQFYYLHPNNLIKGLFIDGSLWLKWACDSDGNVDTESFAYLMSKLSLKNTLSFAKKPLQDISNTVLRIINPIFDGIKNFIGEILKKVLGATGIGGVIVNFLSNVISDKFAYITSQIVMIFILGIAGILFVIFENVGIIYSDDYVKAVMDSADSQQTYHFEEVFMDEDFELL